MNVNAHYLSFPPHLSTSWDQVAALFMKSNGRIEVQLKSGENVLLPEMTSEETEVVFRYHSLYLLKQAGGTGTAMTPFLGGFRLEIGSSEGLVLPLQHNPDDAQSPELPEEAIMKIAEMAKSIVPPEHLDAFIPESDCRCTYCEIARIIRGEQEDLAEIALLEEKQESAWEVRPMGNKLYSVVNQKDQQESYSVYLGEPIGCTCGKSRCVHILTVLKS